MTLATDLRRLREDVGELLARHDRAQDISEFEAYAEDPIGFVRDVLGDTDPGPWWRQVEIAEAVRDHPLVAVRSNNSAGKDWLAARLALWWVYARGGLALVTGPTERQVVEVVMGQVARAFRRASSLPGDLYRSALRVGETEEAGILAFTSTEASRLTGFHAGRVFCVLTEAQAVEDFAWEGLLACATGPEDRLLAVGNPVAPDGRFYRASRAGTWKAIRVSAKEHPNVVEGRMVIPGGVSRAFVERIASEYGASSGVYRSRVLGEFPDQGEDALCALEWVVSAAERWQDEEEHEDRRPRGLPIVAIDPARFGPDQTVAAVMRGSRVVRILAWRGASTMESVGRVAELLREEGIRPKPKAQRSAPGGFDAYGRPTKFALPAAPPEETGRIVVDEIGVGGGIVDRLRERGFEVTSFNGGGRPRGKGRERHLNLRAQGYWTLRRALERGEISLPPDDDLRQELVSMRWGPTSSGQIQIEAKTELRARLGRSPDKADAVSMAVLEWARLRARAARDPIAPSLSFTDTSM